MANILSLSGEHIIAVYHLHMPLEQSQDVAELICHEHTVELSPQVVPSTLKEIIGEVLQLKPLGENRHICEIAYAWELAADNLPGLLGLVMGNASFFNGVELVDIKLPPISQIVFKGPRFGEKTIRKQLGKACGAISGTALKPLGCGSKELTQVAYSFACGGIDIIKEDDGIINQIFVLFKERVLRCTDAIQKAYAKTNKKTLYIPNITGPIDTILECALFAQESGADGIEIFPGLLGFDIVRMLSQSLELNVPIYTHSAWNGGLCRQLSSVISYAVLFGLLPRLAGADVSIAPTFGGRFNLSKDNCKDMGGKLKRHYNNMQACLPMVGGGISFDNISNILSIYGENCIILISGALFQAQNDLTLSTKNFVDILQDV